MVQKLRPVIQLNSEDWPAILERHKLKGVMSEAHVQILWCRMQKVLDADIWYAHQEAAGTADSDREVLSYMTDHGQRMNVLAAATLGAGVDAWIAELSDQGQILDSYAADCLAMEALQCLYRLLEDQLAQRGLYITRYCFPEPTEEGCLQMAEILQALHCSEEIQLTDEGMLRPMKSVIFTGLLTTDREKRCSTICTHCSRSDCPNRYSLHMGNYREPGALRYSYGYQRIFGRS